MAQTLEGAILKFQCFEATLFVVIRVTSLEQLSLAEFSGEQARL